MSRDPPSQVRLRSVPPPRSGRRPPPAPLPVPLTPLVGRERETALADSLLRRAEVRLVTLTGPGGVGKTRLAIRVATDFVGAFADGVRFVPLAAVPDSELVVPTIAGALGLVAESGGTPMRDRLAAALREAELLLVLDNFEHLSGAADVLPDLLAACPSLKILATSRTLLRVSGEHAFPVPPLDVPGPDEGASLEEVTQAPAVRFFAERAAAVAPSFAVTAAIAPLVAEICRRLDGLPLAIELAAARVNVLSLSALWDRLERRLPLLTGGTRDAPARHRTMHDAIAWSHGLLTEEEQTVFRSLSVFAGGFTLDAAEAVASAPGNRTLDILHEIASLVDKSLLQREVGADGAPRLGMLETIREFAVAQLVAGGEEAAVRGRHAAWCLDLAERFGEGFVYDPEDLWWLRQAEVELDNMRAALAWLERVGETGEMLRLARAIEPLWRARGHHAEAIGWFERGLAAGEAVPAVTRLWTMLEMGRPLQRQGHFERARSLFEQALSLARELEEPRAIAQSLHALGSAETNQGHYDLAASLFAEALALFRRLGDDDWIAGSHYFLSIIAYGRDAFAEATAQIGAALEVRRAFGPTFSQAVYLNALGLLSCEQADAANGAQALAASGSILQASQETNRELLAEWLAAVARLAAARGQLEPAARLYGAAEAFTEAIGVPLVVPPRPQYRRAVEALWWELGEDAFTVAWAAGRDLPLGQAIEDARALAEAASAVAPSATALLTPREREILILLAAGQTDKAIAAALFLSVRTVEAHVAHILAKLGVRTRTAAVTAAVAAGLLAPDAPAQAAPPP